MTVENPLRAGKPGAILANAVIFLIVAFAALLNELNPDQYYLSVQEDEYIEWATVWAFLIAGIFNFVAAARQRKTAGSMPWFLAGVGLFCIFVLLEEISWGQRIIGYRPPEYFLDQNFQQEFNLHNVVDTSYRKLALATVIAGYGVFLPLALLVPVFRRLFDNLGVVAPPLGFAPAFAATFLVYEIYPWRFAGEWVECLLGLGFMFTSLVAARHFRHHDHDGESSWRSHLRPLGFVALVFVFGWVAALGARYERQVHPGTLAAVDSELAALKNDFESGKVRRGCGVHKRLYTFVRDYDEDYLMIGAFAGLVDQGLPEQRAEFFLDPWNSPYWIRDRCASRGNPRTMFVYSLGPNRRRDSTRDEILGDDIGEYLGYRRRRSP
ncbi:MAG: hypothetical protein ACE5F8_06195 [Woeseiaceae bacterium]